MTPHFKKCLLRGADVSRFRGRSGFKGALVLVQRNGRFSFELCRCQGAGELAIKSYTKKAGGPPKEMFIHGKCALSE